MEGLTFKFDCKWLSISDLEEEVEVMFTHFLGEVVDADVCLLPWGKGPTSWLDREDVLREDVPLKRLVIGRLARIGPCFHFDFGIIGQFKVPIRLNSTYILDCKRYSSWF